MQAQNPSTSIPWGSAEYKVGDPILFNDSPRFSPLIYNNIKGTIHDIKIEDHSITFDIKLKDLSLTSLDVTSCSDIDFIGNDEDGKTVIRFLVNKYKSTDFDSNDPTTVVPFQIAYATSIHKAQGLEYDSVKVVITNESEENITHSIFYTAVTRAKDKLIIYWSPETEKHLLENMEKRNNSKDGNFIKMFL